MVLAVFLYVRLIRLNLSGGLSSLDAFWIGQTPKFEAAEVRRRRGRVNRN